MFVPDVRGKIPPALPHPLLHLLISALQFGWKALKREIGTISTKNLQVKGGQRAGAWTHSQPVPLAAGSGEGRCAWKPNCAAHSDTAAVTPPGKDSIPSLQHPGPLAEGLAGQVGRVPGMKPFRRAISPPPPPFTPSLVQHTAGTSVPGTAFPSTSSIFKAAFYLLQDCQDNLLIQGGSGHLPCQNLISPAAKLRRFRQHFLWCCY